MKNQQPAVRISHISKSFGAVRALEDISISLESGRLLAIVGPNGSGKTTLLRCMLGLVWPDKGDISVAGLNPRTNAFKVKQQVTVVPDESDVIGSLTAREYLAFTASLYRIEPARAVQRIDDILNLMGLQESADRLSAGFSHGMLKKLQIAAALISDARLLIIDEPTNGLDPDMTILIRSLLGQLRDKGFTIVLATHQLAFAEHIADDILILRTTTFAYGPLSKVLASAEADTLDAAYQKLTQNRNHESDIKDFLAD